jgi:predicted amidohydrolase
MISTIRFLGAQMPVTRDLAKNICNLKEAMDQASSMDADYLVTPECALSGYMPDFDSRDGRTFNDLLAAEIEVVEYAASKKVGLCLGTMWIEDEGLRRNQIRFYDQSGQLSGITNKTLAPPFELVIPEDQITLINLEIPNTGTYMRVLGLICNDMWGEGIHLNSPPMQGSLRGAQLVVHVTNGRRGFNQLQDIITNTWHDAHLKMISYSLIPGIITVDNCYTDLGDEYNGPTSSESGVLINGIWRTFVPRTGTQYFTYDFKFKDGILVE